MADTISTKRITDLPEDTDVNDNDLFMAGSNGTASLRKKKWSTLLAKIKSVLLANNLTTTTAGYALDARQGKALKDQVDQLNTKIAKVNYARTIAVSANTQNYISFSITVPDGYEILSANISAQHNTILIGQAIVSGNALYFPYISTTSYSSEIFTLDVFFIKL